MTRRLRTLMPRPSSSTAQSVNAMPTIVAMLTARMNRYQGLEVERQDRRHTQPESSSRRADHERAVFPVKHPLYTAVALLVLPWIGFLLNTWLGALIGIVLYVGSRIYAPAEEASLSETFGAKWDEYSSTVKMPWL